MCFSRGFGCYVFGTLGGNEANISTYYYLVPCRLSTDPKICDLMWLWMAWMAILRYMFTTMNCHWLIICCLFSVGLFITRGVKSGEVREAECSKQWSAERQHIWNPLKICGSSVDAISSEPQQITPISYYFIAFPLTPKHVTLNDLESPFCLKFCFVLVCLELWSLAFEAWLLNL